MKKKSKSFDYSKYVIISLVVIAFFSLIFFLENPSKMASENTKSTAVFVTSKGEIKIELFLDKMPITAGNFKKLVEEGFYDETRFHRVIPNFMVQGGDPLSKDVTKKNSWGTGGSENIQDEFVEGLSNVRGSLSMANTGRPNSGSSQFFINVADNTFLDFDKEPLASKHPVFAKVVEGMDVVDSIVNVETTGSPFDRPVEDVIILRAYIE